MKNLSPGTLILGIFAVLFGLVGAYATKQYLQSRPNAETAEEETILTQAVPLASVDIPTGRTVSLGDVMLVRMTREEAKRNGIPGGYMTNPKQIVGRTVREPIEKGKAFFIDTFYPDGIGPSVADRLKPGFRAVTISLPDTAAEVGLVSPGSVVDVIFKASAVREEEIPETTITLLEQIEVLAIGYETFQGMIASQDDHFRTPREATVTLAVTPEQAGSLKAVEGRGSLSLVLRGISDGQTAGSSSPKTLASVLGLPKPTKPAKPFTTQIYRRGRLTTNVFEKGRQTITEEIATASRAQTNATMVAHSGAPTKPASQTSQAQAKPCCQNN